MIIATCAVWGNWPETYIGKNSDTVRRGGHRDQQKEYIVKLRDAVKRNLPVEHRFVCAADDVSKVPEGIEAIKLDVPRFSRAMPKAYLYGAPFTGCPFNAGDKVLVFDLDNVIIGDLSFMLDHSEDLVAREKTHPLPNRVVDGDEIFSLAGSDKARHCAEIMRREMTTNFKKTDGGDERELLGEAGAKMWCDVAPGKVVTYKHHCLKHGHPPVGASIVSFHGKPLPHDVEDAWVKEHWV